MCVCVCVSVQKSIFFVLLVATPGKKCLHDFADIGKLICHNWFMCREVWSPIVLFFYYKCFNLMLCTRESQVLIASFTRYKIVLVKLIKLKFVLGTFNLKWRILLMFVFVENVALLIMVALWKGSWIYWLLNWNTTG